MTASLLEAATAASTSLSSRAKAGTGLAYYADSIVDTVLTIGGTPYDWILTSTLPSLDFAMNPREFRMIQVMTMRFSHARDSSTVRPEREKFGSVFFFALLQQLRQHPNFRVLPFFRTEVNEKRRFFIEKRQNVISAHSPAQV